MRHFSKKRILLVGSTLTTVGAAAALLAAGTFGFFSSGGTPSGDNTFTAGKVLVGLGTGTQVTCAIGPMSPGDNQDSVTSHPGFASTQNAVCEYDVAYTGNVNAFMALDLAITGAGGATTAAPYLAHTLTTAPPANQGLYDGTSTGLQLGITDGASTSYMSGIQYAPQVGTATTLVATSGSAAVENLLVNTTPVASGATTHVTVNYSLPSSAGNKYNLATSTLVLTIHAVQADNNGLPVNCALGHVCATGMNWS